MLVTFLSANCNYVTDGSEGGQSSCVGELPFYGSPACKTVSHLRISRLAALLKDRVSAVLAIPWMTSVPRSKSL